MPIWITTAGNGHSLATIYVDYDGDNAGPLTDPNGNKYDVPYRLRELEQQQILDPDGDQSGMLVYSLDPTVRIAAAWAQNPTLATAGQPGLDVSTLIPPLREGEGGKKYRIDTDADGDGRVSYEEALTRKDSTTGTWKQFWVDNSGLVLLLEGGLVEGKMVLQGRRLDAEGATVTDRITWMPNADGSVRQLWESSSDGGQTWSVAFDGLYVKAEGGGETSQTD